MFTIKCSDGVIATSFKANDKVYVAPDKLLPMARFLQPQAGGGGGRGGGRGGFGGDRGGRGGEFPAGRYWQAGLRCAVGCAVGRGLCAALETSAYGPRCNTALWFVLRARPTCCFFPSSFLAPCAQVVAALCLAAAEGSAAVRAAVAAASCPVAAEASAAGSAAAAAAAASAVAAAGRERPLPAAPRLRSDLCLFPSSVQPTKERGRRVGRRKAGKRHLRSSREGGRRRLILPLVPARRVGGAAKRWCRRALLAAAGTS